MNKLLNYILSTVIVLTFFSACTQEEVDVFAPGNDGAYFRPNSNGSMDTTVNFANHLLDETPEVSIPIDVSILGYINGTGTRRAVIKTKPVEGYDMADVAVDELIFEAGEYQKSVNVRVSPPDTMGKVYAVCLYFDSEDPASQLGMGINGRTEFTIYVTESYSRPSNWNSSLSLYLGAWSVEKHKFMVHVLHDDQYTQSSNWGDFSNFNKLAVDSARKYNQAHPDDPLPFAIPIVEYCTYDTPPYYWGPQQEKFFGTYTSQHFVSLAKALNMTTQNEVALVGTNDEAVLAENNRQAVRGMMVQYNEYYSWYYLNATDYEDFINIPVLPNIDYDVVKPKMWSEEPSAEVVRNYYGEYSPEKYRFILRTLSAALGSNFTLARLFPMDIFYDFNGQLNVNWNSKLDGENLMKQYHDIVKAAYDNTPGLGFEIP